MHCLQTGAKDVFVPDILLIAQDIEEKKRLNIAIQRDGCVVCDVATTVDALVAVSESSFDLVIIDEQLFADSGLGIVKTVLAKDPDAQVIVIVESAASVSRLAGKDSPATYDFFLKDADPLLLGQSISRALEVKETLRARRLLEGANNSLRHHLDEQADLSLRLEQELKRFKDIMDTVGVPVALIGRDRTVTWCNKAYDELLSYRDEVFCMHAACQGSKCKQCVITDIFSGKLNYSRKEVQCLIPDSDVNWFEIIDTPLRRATGEILGVVEVALPIDERKQHQRLLEETKHSLEFSVAERTLSLKDSKDRLEHEVEVRKHTEKRMQAELELNAAVAALANSLVTGSESLEEVAGSALEYALSFTGSSIGFITKIDSETNENQILASSGVDPQCLNRLTMGSDQSILGSLPIHGHFGQRPFFSNDKNDKRLKALPSGHFSISNCINAPVIVEGRLGGTIMTANAKKEYTYDDLGAVLRMSSLFALAIQRWNKEHELIRAKSLAEEANKAKTQFLANMSHELRTPLNGIMGSARVLLELGPEHEQREFLDLIMKSGSQLLMLINDLLVLSNLELRRFSSVSTQFCLTEMMESIFGMYQAQARHKGLDFSFSNAPDVPGFIIADPNCFKLVLTNLIANAIQFTSKGSIRIATKFASRPVKDKESGQYNAQLAISVSDTGEGVPKEMQEAIFEQFTLVEDFMTKRYGGAGLGLSICKQLITLMGGDIWVESEPGRGSTFTFTFDIALDPSFQREDCFSASKPTPEIPLYVLYAEDEFTNQELVKRFLEKRGHKVVLASDGLEALERLRFDPHFDLVLMDLKMPRVDGIEATRKIRAGECGHVDPDIPIIAVTAFASERERARGREAGLNAYITKPVDLKQLVESMYQVVLQLRRNS